MLSADILSKLKRLKLESRKLQMDSIQGAFSSFLLGQGLEFDRVREYEVGDDVRSIDWNVTARSQTVHTKVFVEERALSVCVLVDVSRPMGFSTQVKTKLDIARELVAYLGFLTVSQNDIFSSLAYSDHGSSRLINVRQPKEIWPFLAKIQNKDSKQLSTYLAEKKQDELLKSVLELKKRMRPNSMLIWISDFLEEIPESVLRILQNYFSTTLVRVRDEREVVWDGGCFEKMSDFSYASNPLWFDASVSSLREEFEQKIEIEDLEFRDLIRKYAFSFWDFKTNEPSTIDHLSHCLLSQKRVKRR